jgi:hypothetical protein
MSPIVGEEPVACIMCRPFQLAMCVPLLAGLEHDHMLAGAKHMIVLAALTMQSS